MSRILDGPGGPMRNLDNGRAPLFLRVTIDEEAGLVDVLDQPEDEPRPTERVHVYERVPGTYHGLTFVTLDRPRRCISIADGDYRHRPDVDGELLRDNDVWRAWATVQPEPVAS